MTRIVRGLNVGAPLVALALFLVGCTALSTEVLVDEKAAQAQAPVVSHCKGGEWTDNSMMAVVPLPIIGFGVPTQEINDIEASDVLSKCGPPERLANRHVEVDRIMCVPTAITRVLSLGVWHWCPAHVSYQADVTAPAPEPAAPVATTPEFSEHFNVPTYRLGARYRD